MKIGNPSQFRPRCVHSPSYRRWRCTKISYLVSVPIFVILMVSYQPGYRIRQLTAAEETEKVRDDVKRLREGEKLLLRNYKQYLKSLEGEIKREFALHTMGTYPQLQCTRL